MRSHGAFANDSSVFATSIDLTTNKAPRILSHQHPIRIIRVFNTNKTPKVSNHSQVFATDTFGSDGVCQFKQFKQFHINNFIINTREGRG